MPETSPRPNIRGRRARLVLDAYIINEIKKRDDRQRREDAERPRLEIEPPTRRRREDRPEDAPSDDERSTDDDAVHIRLL